jgi:hypothetical protein
MHPQLLTFYWFEVDFPNVLGVNVVLEAAHPTPVSTSCEDTKACHLHVTSLRTNGSHLLENFTCSSFSGEGLFMSCFTASTRTVTISDFRVLAIRQSYSLGTLMAKKLSLSSLKLNFSIFCTAHSAQPT